MFAVEVRSPEDYGPVAERAMAAKRADYFAAGSLVVWDVDVFRDGVVRVYRADDPLTSTMFRRGEHADAEPAVPGWSMPVDDLFLPAVPRQQALPRGQQGHKQCDPVLAAANAQVDR